MATSDRLVEAVVGPALAWNERLLNRHHPIPDGLLDPADHSWTEEIEASYPTIRAEVDALVADHVQLPTVNELMGSDQGSSGRWSTMILFSHGRWIPEHTARAPRTAQLLATVPGLLVGGFSVLGPRTHLPRHRGPCRGGLRYHMGIRLPSTPGAAGLGVGAATHRWSEGASALFDDATEHEAWNDGDEDRYVLYVEFVMPVTGVAGASNRAAQRLLGVAARQIPGRVTRFDRALNG